jgi:hypothetical protein
MEERKMINEDNLKELEEFPPHKDEEVLKQEAIISRLKENEVKKEALNKIVVTNHGVEYNGDMTAQSNMGDAGTIVNWMFNKNIGTAFKGQASQLPDGHPAKELFQGIGDIFDGLYKTIYIDQKTNWKGADNKVHRVQGESILEALLETMKVKGSIVAKK